MKFRKKPVVIEAVRFTVQNQAECMAFCPTAFEPPDRASWKYSLVIPTLEGNHLCSEGDWIIKGIKGEFYPIKNDIFAETYERAEDAGGRE